MTNEILIVDDEDRIRRLLKLYLEKNRLRFMKQVMAKKHNLAIENDYACILLDLMLPEMDGIEVASSYVNIKTHLLLCLQLKAKKRIG